MISNVVALEAITDRTMGLAKQILAQGVVPAAFGSKDALVDAGLSSLDLVNLMFAIEAEFDIMIPPTQLTPGNFYSASSIAHMVVAVKPELALELAA